MPWNIIGYYGSSIDAKNIRNPMDTSVAVYVRLSAAYLESRPAAPITMNAKKNNGYLYFEGNIFFTLSRFSYVRYMQQRHV